MDRALHTRRRILCIGATALVAGLAGCSDGSGTDEPPGEPAGDEGANQTDGGMSAPPDDVGSDEGLGRGADDRQGTVTATVVVGPDGERVFDPETAEVQLGERVRWEWDSGGHTITPAETPSNADWGGEPREHDAGHVYEHRFEAAGTFEYYCAPHRDAGMTGTVEVQE